MSYSDYTYEEAKIWVAKVKGKKLRRNYWYNTYKYFIPTGKLRERFGYVRFEGIIYYNDYTENDYWWVGRGFELNENGRKWILMYDWETELESLK